MFSRQDFALKLGRRVSRGEFERAFTRYVSSLVVVQSTSKGKQTEAKRVMPSLHPACPKYKRKH